MRKVIKVDPITRIEGHMAVDCVVDDGVVKEARSQGTMFRGFEIILKGRDPRDASRFAQRICGVCPSAHSTASSLCLDDAFGIKDKIPKNGRLIRGLIFGSNFLQSHILHFYHLAALDYVDAARTVGNVSPFVPRYEGDYRVSKEVTDELVGHYVQALDIRRKCHEMLAIFGGKMPHNVGIVAGGVTLQPTEDRITNFLWRLNEIREFIDNVYLPDVIAVAKAYDDYFGIGKGCGSYMSYGGLYSQVGTLFQSGVVSEKLEYEEFDMKHITEDVKHSWLADMHTGMNPADSDTEPDMTKAEAYSFLKSPRYKGKVFEH
jgi:hydrogenase large subunit